MRARRTDAKHKEVARAFETLGLPFLDTSGAGGGLEDFVVGLRTGWLMVEVKTILNKRGTVKPSQYTPAQQKWRAMTTGLPRITVTGFEDAMTQLRAVLGI